MERERHLLYRCATGDESFIARQCAMGTLEFAALEPKADALVRISAVVALGAPEALCRSAIAARFEAGACDEDVVATLISVATIIGRARVASAAPAIARGIGYDIDGALQTLTGRRTSSESDDGASNRTAPNIQCAGRQLLHTGRSCAQMIGSTRRWGVGGEYRCERATRRHRPNGVSSNGNCGSSMSRCRTAASRRSRAFARPGFWCHDPVRPLGTRAGAPRQLAHRTDVRAVRGERAVPKGDAERSERGGRCLRTTSTRRIQRLPRHVANRLPPRAALREVRRALLDGPFARDPVTRAASDFGFWHLSRFAGQYRALFGESPSETVARARARLPNSARVLVATVSLGDSPNNARYWPAKRLRCQNPKSDAARVTGSRANGPSRSLRRTSRSAATRR